MFIKSGPFRPDALSDTKLTGAKQQHGVYLQPGAIEYGATVADCEGCFC